MTMTLDEASDVLKVAQRFDRRTVAKGDIEAWYGALFGLEYDECAAAVIRHYAVSTDFAMPAHIRRLVDEYRVDLARKSGHVDGANHCGRPSCPCTHTAPCDHGWIEAAPPGATSLAGASPCPTCKPGRQQQHGESRQQWHARLQEQNLAWQRKQNLNP